MSGDGGAVLGLLDLVNTLDALDRAGSAAEVVAANLEHRRAVDSARALLREIDSGDSGIAAPGEGRLTGPTRAGYEKQVDGQDPGPGDSDQRDGVERHAPVGERPIHPLAQHADRSSPGPFTPPGDCSNGRRPPYNPDARCASTTCRRVLRPKGKRFWDPATNLSFCNDTCFRQQREREVARGCS